MQRAYNVNVTFAGQLPGEGNEALFSVATRQSTDSSPVSSGGVTLADNTLLVGGAVTFNGAVDAATAGQQALEVRSPGATTFAGRVGATAALASLTTDAPGQTRLGVASGG